MSVDFIHAELVVEGVGEVELDLGFEVAGFRFVEFAQLQQSEHFGLIELEQKKLAFGFDGLGLFVGDVEHEWLNIGFDW